MAAVLVFTANTSLGGAEWTDWPGGLRFPVSGWGFRVWILGFRFSGFGFRVFGFLVSGFKFEVSGLEFRGLIQATGHL